MDKKFKNDVQDWIKRFAMMGKELDALNREAKKQKFSQAQRQLEIISKNFKSKWMSAVKRLFTVVK